MFVKMHQLLQNSVPIRFDDSVKTHYEIRELVTEFALPRAPQKPRVRTYPRLSGPATNSMSGADLGAGQPCIRLARIS